MHLYCDVTLLCKYGALKSYLFLVLSRAPLRDFGHILTLLPSGASMFHKHMSNFLQEISTHPYINFSLFNRCSKFKLQYNLSKPDPNGTKYFVWFRQDPDYSDSSRRGEFLYYKFVVALIIKFAYYWMDLHTYSNSFQLLYI